MKRIYFFSIPLFGHVNYGLKLARKMKMEGYEVIYYSGNSYKNFIESKGICFHSYSKDIEKLFSEDNSTYNSAFMSNVEPEKQDHIVEWYNFCSHLYKIRDIFMKNDIYSMNKPDLIIYDSAALWGKSIAEHFKVKSIASCTPYYYPEEYARSDYTEFAKLIFQKTYNKSKASRVVYMMEKSLNGSVIEPLSPIADYRLIYSVKAFQSGTDYIGNQTYFVGPLIEEDDYSEDDSDLISRDMPNIYISFGSIYNNGNVFRKIYEACKDLEYNFILNVGNYNDLSAFIDLPDNWHVVSRINQISTLKKVQLFISHGGANSVREAMYFGVPIIVMPAEGDTLCNAKDIEKCQVGKTISVSQLDIIKSSVIKVLNDSEVLKNCNNISKEMTKAGGIEKAFGIIKKVMEDIK